METTTNKIGTKYKTGLLWHSYYIILPKSNRVAQQRLLSFEKKLERNKKLKKLIQTKITEYIAKEYMVSIYRECFAIRRHWYFYLFFRLSLGNKPHMILHNIGRIGCLWKEEGFWDEVFSIFGLYSSSQSTLTKCFTV